MNNSDVCPSIENEFNYSYVADVLKLPDQILSDVSKITTRTTKYILSLQLKVLDFLIGEVNKRDKNSILHELVNIAYANENNINLYKQNLITLKRFVFEYNNETIKI